VAVRPSLANSDRGSRAEVVGSGPSALVNGSGQCRRQGPGSSGPDSGVRGIRACPPGGRAPLRWPRRPRARSRARGRRQPQDSRGALPFLSGRGISDSFGRDARRGGMFDASGHRPSSCPVRVLDVHYRASSPRELHLPAGPNGSPAGRLSRSRGPRPLALSSLADASEDVLHDNRREAASDRATSGSQGHGRVRRPMAGAARR